MVIDGEEQPKTLFRLVKDTIPKDKPNNRSEKADLDLILITAWLTGLHLEAKWYFSMSQCSSWV